MESLLLIIAIVLPGKEPFSGNIAPIDANQAGIFLSANGEETRDEFIRELSGKRLSSERFDSSNVRFVGNWPFGRSNAVELDPDRNLAFCGSGGGVYILDVSDPGNPGKVSEKIHVRSTVVALFYQSSTQTLYLAAEETGLEIWDVSNFENPEKLGSYGKLDWTFDVAVSGDYAYLADGGGLRIINVSVPSNLTEMGYCETPGSARGVAVSGNYAYIADDQSGLRIIDISTPSDPFEVGDVPGYANDVAVSGDYAYVADYYNVLRVINIFDPEVPEELGQCDLPGHAYGVDVSGNYAYVIYRAEVYMGPTGMDVIDISTPSNPEAIGSYNWSWSWYSVNEVVVSGDYVYVADGESGLRFIDISTPSDPVEVSSYNVPATPYGSAEISGDYAYVASSASGFHVIDISDSENPREVGFLDVSVKNVAVSGDYAYAGRYELNVVDISDPESPQQVGFLDLSPNILTVSGDYIYAITANRDVYVIDISDPENPEEVGFFETGYLGNVAIAVSGDYAYLTEDYDRPGLHVIDISDPENPEEVGFCDTPGSARDIAISGNYAYVANYSDLRIIDISTPSNPIEVNNVSCAARYLAVSGDCAYVVQYSRFCVIDISDPENPVELGYYDTPAGFPSGVAISGGYIYVATEGNGLQIYEYLPSGIEITDTEGKKVLNISKNLFMETTEVSLSGMDFPVTLNVYDVTGRLREKTAVYNSSPLKVGSGLSPGVYFVSVKDFKPVKVMKLR